MSLHYFSFPQTALSRPAWSAGGHWTCGACFMKWELNGAMIWRSYRYICFWNILNVQSYTCIIIIIILIFLQFSEIVRILQTCAFIFHCVVTWPCNRQKKSYTFIMFTYYSTKWTALEYFIKTCSALFKSRNKLYMISFFTSPSGSGHIVENRFDLGKIVLSV